MFHRHCLEHIGTTPARLLEKLRVEQARTLLTTTSMPAKAIAAAAGLENPTNVEGSQSSRDMSLDRLSWNEFVLSLLRLGHLSLPRCIAIWNETPASRRITLLAIYCGADNTITLQTEISRFCA